MAERRARVEEMRRAQESRDRRQRLAIFGGGGVVILVVIALIVALALRPGKADVTVEAPAVVVANTTGIDGVVAYDTSGYPGTTGDPAKALPHTHVTNTVRYSVIPPVGGDHSGSWLNCGVYDHPVADVHAVHDLEHGAVWITYQPSLPPADVKVLRAFVAKQTNATYNGQDLQSKYVDLTPYPGLTSKVVMSSWGYQLKLDSVTDPRMQQFVDKLRVNATYTPEYGSACGGTPASQGGDTPLTGAAAL